MDAYKIAKVVNHLKESNVEIETKKYVGVELTKKINDMVNVGDVIAKIYINNKTGIKEICEELLQAFVISKVKAIRQKLIVKFIR
jgi:thymidine phosphorylase